jgi:hypothetical protein
LSLTQAKTLLEGLLACAKNVLANSLLLSKLLLSKSSLSL